MARWTQQQVEEWIAKNGGASAVAYDETRSSIPNPLRDINHPDYDPTAPPMISVDRRVWTNTKTGAKLVTEPSDGNGYEVISNEGADPNKAPGSTTTASGADPEELRRQRERNQAAGAGYYTDAEISSGIVAKQTKEETERKDKEAKNEAARKEQETKKNQWTEIKRETDETTGKTVATFRNGLGETEQREVTVNKKPDKNEPRYNAQTGRYEVVEYDERGNPTGVRELASGSGGRTTAPQLPANTHLGTIYTGIQSAAQKIAADETMTPQEKLKAYDQLQKAGELLADETSTILTSQQNTLTNQTSQRNADVQDAASRRTFAAGLVNDSFKDVSGLAEYAPAGSGIAGPAFLGRIMLGMTLADKMGGLKTFPTVQPGAAAQQVYGQGLPGMEPQAQPQAMPQQQQPATPGAGMTLNIINGVPQAPQSVTQAMPPNPALSAAPETMNWNGGQLRAPGYQPEEEEAQIPAFMANAF